MEERNLTCIGCPLGCALKVKNGTIPMVSVKTAQDIPKEKIMDVMDCINRITVEAPVHIGDVLLSDAAATGVDIVATKNVEA